MDNQTRARYVRWRRRKIRRLISLVVLFFFTIVLTIMVLRFFSNSNSPSVQPPADDVSADPGQAEDESDNIAEDENDEVNEDELMFAVPREPVVFCGLADPDDATTISNQDALDYLVLVNRCFRVASDFEPDDLRYVEVPQVNTWSGNHYLRASAATATENLFAEINALDGMNLLLSSAYRSYELQTLFHTNAVNNLGRDEARRVSAVPGHSEHQLGLGIDLTTPALEFQLSNAFSATPEGVWIRENAHRFGFIISYPYASEHMTGFIYEPWHLRYVGIDVANRIFDQGVVLEEFLWYNTRR